MGRPWGMGKALDQSAPYLWGNRAARRAGSSGQVRQRSTLSARIRSPGEILFWLSKYVDFVAGDLISTGTPEGVGPVVAGEVLHARVDHYWRLPRVSTSMHRYFSIAARCRLLVTREEHARWRAK
jgi:fumarylpyruvate hydrolase